ncbi:MAG: phosphoribosylanthranilate isomerase [Candidatus Omnitrophica bacterium]|nr:phosphoribosylanthranilate isomerase [Candidatus Omnitrophota bacterium]
MTRIKICGITNKIDAVNAAELGVDMLGFVFYKKSRRYVSAAMAEDIINELPPRIGKVGVFVDETRESVIKAAEDAGLNMLQFHGDETPEYCRYFKNRFKVIKAFRLKSKSDLKAINDYDADFYLLDAYKSDSIGGTGETFDWKILKDFEILRPVILSGGLTPVNISAAIKEVAPCAVDVSTGVEASPGKKDLTLMKKFVENVRRSD